MFEVYRYELLKETGPGCCDPIGHTIFNKLSLNIVPLLCKEFNKINREMCLVDYKETHPLYDYLNKKFKQTLLWFIIKLRL